MKKADSKKRIVIIDDCQVTLAVVSDILEQAGYIASTAKDSIYSNHLIYTVPPPRFDPPGCDDAFHVGRQKSPYP